MNREYCAWWGISNFRCRERILILIIVIVLQIIEWFKIRRHYSNKTFNLTNDINNVYIKIMVRCIWIIFLIRDNFLFCKIWPITNFRLYRLSILQLHIVFRKFTHSDLVFLVYTAESFLKIRKCDFFSISQKFEEDLC